jgi:primosomal protein N' (replication factor Y)
MKVAEPTPSYELHSTLTPQWVEVLVDCPYAQGLYTYKIPPELHLEIGDIVSVPFGNSLVGGIVLKLSSHPPCDLPEDKIKEIDDLIAQKLFPPYYWQLLQRTANYYFTDLITVVKTALPPKLLGKSQTRVRLLLENIPTGAENFCSPKEMEVLRILQSSKLGDYTHNFINQKIRNAHRAISQLVKRQWVETYLQAPTNARPKYTKVVTFLTDNTENRLGSKQKDVLTVLKNHGGELLLSELKNLCQLGDISVVQRLVDKGCVLIQERESLRLLQDSQPTRDQQKHLTLAQSYALEIINSLNSFATVLLHGVTGSGKTEVYLQAIAPILLQKKSALVLVPEIGLTPQLTDRFRARFGEQVCVYHSGLSDGERYDTWRQMLTGEPQVVIGTRSAIFAPLPNLGIIILDEEHDTSFKQQQPVPTYHANVLALWRGELENCPIIFGSATPSLESWLRATENQPPTQENFLLESYPHYYLSLPDRIQQRPLPPVEIVDMRQELRKGNRSIFSHSLHQALSRLQPEGKQAILFISRRGHSTFVSCRSCGYVMECPHCDVSLSYHYTHDGATELLRCHYCNHTEIHPQKCPDCFSPYLKFFGTGTQKVALELAKEFPDLKVLRFDSDTTRNKNAHRQILSDFANHKADILIGTQMLTKGIDLANVTLVGVVSADGLLFHSDYRSSERAFQTLTQVAGRAGRGDEAGQVIIQTYAPEHAVIQAVQNHDYLTFVQQELSDRESLDYPPYGHLILLRFTGIDGEQVRLCAEAIADLCANLLPEEIEILGPAPANIMRVARRYRWQILLKSLTEFTPEIQTNLLTLKDNCHRNVSLTIDPNPLRIE